MDQVIRKIQLVAVVFILLATALAFLLEVNKMYMNRSVDLADLLLFGNDPSQSQLFFCDFDSNGMLDVMDLLRLSNIILGL